MPLLKVPYAVAHKLYPKSAFNRLVRAVIGLTKISVEAPLELRWGADGEPLLSLATVDQWIRAQLTADPIEGQPSIAKVRWLNDQGLYGREFACALQAYHKAGDEIYVTMPAGGVIGTPVFETFPVKWTEVNGIPTGEWQHQLYGMTTQLNPGWEEPLAVPALDEVET